MVDWDKRYRESPARMFGAAPNEYLREVLARADVAPASALCLGDGDGRNGCWLAAQGLVVTAVDISAEATEQALAHDRAAAVSVERIVADLAHWTPPPASTWDAALMLYLQCEDPVRLGTVALAAAALAPGGWFIAEGFSRRGANQGLGTDSLGPKQADLLYDLDAILGALSGFKIVEAFEGATWLDEGDRHQGMGRVARILARKPGNAG